MRNVLFATAAVGALALAAPAAHANLEIQYSSTGSSYTTLLNSGSNGGFATATAAQLNTINAATGLTFGTLDVSSNSPGTSAQALTTSASVSVSNTTGSTITVFLTFGDTNFALPIAPPTALLTSNYSDTVLDSGGGSYSFASFVNQSNAQNATTGVGTTPLTGGFGSGSSTSDAVMITTLTAPYSMTELLELQLGAGDEITFSNSEKLTSTPEPASMALLGVGLLGLGFVAKRKRSV